MKLDVKFQDSITPFDLGFSETGDQLPVDFGSVQQVTELIPGADGKSAYEIAVENGFEGTETEWLESLRGEDGVDGKDGKPGVDGKDGINGKDGVDGKNGIDGKDGTPCTHRWSGTTLYVTSASGTSQANLKGEKGDKGDAGADGKDGADGYTPVKGTDYFTEADKAETVSAVISALPVYNGEVVAV